MCPATSTTRRLPDMALPTLESLTGALFTATNEVLEDPITYAIGGLNPAPINGWVNHEDKTESFAGGQMTAQDILIEVLKTDVPQPSTADRITLPKLDNLIVAPKDWKNTPSARGWIILVSRVRA